MYNLKDLVSNNKMVKFIFYRDGDLWYTTEDGFKFPVPIKDIGSATFNSEEKALLLMRYMRKYMQDVEQAKNAQKDA